MLHSFRWILIIGEEDFCTCFLSNVKKDKMRRAGSSRAFVFATIAGGSFLAGVLFEQRRIGDKLDEFANLDPYILCNKANLLKNVERKPGLPIFGTVSAAVPVPAEVDKSVSIPGRVSQIMKYGFPGLDNVRSFSDYVLSYDRRNRVAHWVFEHLTADSVKHNDAVDRSKCDFMPDESIHPYFRSENTDYKKSGFDRGHLAAAGNHRRHQKHCEETFFLSNMAPQVGSGFNRDSWNRLERHVRKMTKVYPNVYVCTGPLYLPRKESDGKMYVKYQVIGANTVAVPTHFYKVVVAETADNKLEMEAYVMPNQVIKDNTPLEVFQVPPETVERAAGLLFFDKVNRKQLSKINGRKV